MNIALKIILSMSISGTLLIFVLLLAKRVWQDKISRQWQYYIWLIVILRLIFPFAPEVNLMRTIYQAAEQMQTQNFFVTKLQTTLNFVEDRENSTSNRTQASDKINDFIEGKMAEQPLQDNALLQAKSQRLRDFPIVLLWFVKRFWLVWLVVAFGMIVRKITVYQSFVNFVKAGLIPVCDIEKLEDLSAAMERIGIKRPVELGVNPLVSSPMLIGFFNPCIVLPNADIGEKDFYYIILHELIHLKRRDILYKWLMQFTVCLHWFNPMVYLMRREIIKGCEFSCDEAVLGIVGEHYASNYGKTLLDAMPAVGKYKESFGAVTLNQNKQLLRERLCAIMSFRKKSKGMVAVTGVLTLSILFGTIFIGIYPVVAAQPDLMQERHFQESNYLPENNAKKKDINSLSAQIKQYYEAGNVPLFQIAFAQLDNGAKEAWLEQIYIDGQIPFFGAAVDQLEMDSVIIQRLSLIHI